MKAIGIDLGTTNSAAAYYKNGEACILPTRMGEPLTPSVVALRKSRRKDSEEGTLLVGRAAVDYAPRDPENAIFSIKRLMGHTSGEEKVEEVKSRVSYAVVESSRKEDPLVRVVLGDKQYTPAEISTMILKQIKEDAEKAEGETFTHAVITVPAYFEERQRAATRQAGEAAGFVVKKIIDEPTAAAIAFGVKTAKGKKHRVMVYDLGGGTFDISIIQMVKDKKGKDQFQVLEIEGDNWLGGDDFDREIVARIIEEVKKESDFDPSTDKKFLLLAKKQAEKAKIALSSTEEVDLILPAAIRTPDGETIDIDMPLTRDEFEDMIKPYLDRTVEKVHQALKNQNFKPNDISELLLVGGSTLIPCVYQTLEAIFGKNKVKRNINPMECVALGAAVLAGTLKGVECPNPECKHINNERETECRKCGAALASAQAVGDMSITEPTPMHLGIAAVVNDKPDVFVPIIEKGTIYPLKEPKTETFYPTSERQITVDVYEGMEVVASKNKFQGRIMYQLDEAISLDTPVNVSFDYTRDRELSVTIQVQGTNFQKTETLRRDRPRQDSPASRVEQPQEEDWKEQLETVIAATERFVEQYSSYMETKQSEKIAADLNRAREALESENGKEGRKLVRILELSIITSGVASQLFLAERATSGVEPAVAEKIARAASQLRTAYAQGDQEEVKKIEGALKVAVAAAIQKRAAQREIKGREDFEGLLRLLEQKK